MSMDVPFYGLPLSRSAGYPSPGTRPVRRDPQRASLPAAYRAGQPLGTDQPRYPLDTLRRQRT